MRQLSELQKMVQSSSLEQLYSNITLHADFYKYTHPGQYIDGLEKLFMYCEPRLGGQYKKVCFFGLQMIIKEHFMSVPSFQQLLLTQKWVHSASGGFDYFAMQAWKRVEELGYLPFEINAIPEGTVVPEGTPLFYFTSTDPFFTKHQGMMEDLLMHVWAPTTLSSRFLNLKENVRPYFEKTGCLDDLNYSILDFSLRSATCPQDAVRKGTAFLMHFNGSDNTPADVIGIMKHYNGPQVLKSVWATEHSVALAYGPGDGEIAYLKDQLIKTPKDAILSFVIDTYDDKKFMDEVVGNEEIKKLIKERSAATVGRPDSGNAQEKIDMCTYFFEKHFGSHEENGYMVLNNHCKTLMGNNVNEFTTIDDYKYITEKGWSAKNLVEASGKGYFTENVSRDTQRFAIKPSLGIINGIETPMAKRPKGDAWKASKAGYLKVQKDDDGKFKTVTSMEISKDKFDAIKSELVPVFRNGVLLRDYTYEEVQTQIESTKNNF